jgi:hypothetical protein
MKAKGSLAMNRSQLERSRLPAKRVFSWGLVAIGAFVGIIAGMLWKMIWGGRSMFLMQGGGCAGLLVGALVARARLSLAHRRYVAARAANPGR